MMKLSEAAAMIDAELHGADHLFTAVSKDTRSIGPGDLYVAIRGERFDGHAFLEQARSAGAVGALVQELQPVDIPQLVVDDTRSALGRLAAGWRRRFHGSVIGLTGSNGKTTVKEMCRHILAAVAGGDRVLATEGNLNNDIGVPMTLLRLRPHHRFAVIEMGANHVGEIAGLTSIARPDVALVNNAGPAHLEGFGSLDNVARAKAEIYQGLSAEGVAVINLDDRYAGFWRELCGAYRRTTFSIDNSEADVHCTRQGDAVTVHHGESEAELALGVPGRHNLANALAAIASCLALGIELDTVVSALAGFRNIGGRLSFTSLPGGARVIDDSYNANPMSMRAGIDVLCEQAAKKILVLGDMGELGEDARRLHAEIGAYARDAGVDRLFAVGELSSAAAEAFGEGARHYRDKKTLHDELAQAIDAGSVVLVKGSRSMKMETIVAALTAGDLQPEAEVN